MWKNWFLMLIGLWLVLLGFSGFPSETLKILIIISGLAVAFFSFKNVSRHKVYESVKHLPDEPEEQEIEDQQEPTT
jgi:uncharacterized membrane protein required for colicin V production